MMEAENLRVEVFGHTLLDGVSLRIAPGHVVAVVGPNGAGKSTLLRALGGDIKPARGSVRLGDKPLAAWTLHEQACRRAVLAQAVPLAFPFTAFEVVLMGRSPRSSPRTRVSDHAIAFAALRVVDAEDLATRFYPTLSGGERQRVQLARALTQIWDAPEPDGPRYLLLDEPTSSLDIAQQHRVLEEVRRFARRGVGVLVILHDLNLASRYADEIALLRDGRLICAGAPAAVLNAQTIEQTFGVQTVFLKHDGVPYAVVVPGNPAASHSTLN